MSDGVVQLSPPTEDDVEVITSACQDPLIAQWVPVPQPYGPADAEAFLANVVRPGWESGTELTWAVRDADGELLGMVGLHRIEHHSGEIGYWLAHWARGHGVMGRAVSLVVDHGLDPAGLDLLRIYWRAIVGNWPSRRVAWRAGFRVEGTVRADVVHRDGVRRDAWVGTILRGDPRRPNEPWPGSAAADDPDAIVAGAEPGPGRPSRPAVPERI